MPSFPRAFPARIFAAALALTLSACLGTTDAPRQGVQKSPSIRLIPVREPTLGSGAAKRAAGNRAAGLESFQVAISSISLYRDITINGSGWGNPVGPFNLFQAPDWGAYGFITGENALDPANDRYFVDFMSPGGLSRIATSAPFTSGNLGEYNYAVVSWEMPFRVRASIPLDDGLVLYTKAGASIADPGTPHFTTHTAASMLTGPAETSVAVKNNGGTWFRFLKPLTLTEADFNATALVRDTSRRDSLGNIIDTLVPAGQLNVMLVFNPEEFLAGWDTAYSPGEWSGLGPDITGPGGVGNILVPFLDATAVPYRQGEVVWRETYLIDAENPSPPRQGIRTRFEIYTVGDNIVAASLRGLVGPRGEHPVETPIVSFVEASGGGGLLSVQDYAHAPILDGFIRLPAPGISGRTDLALGMGIRVTGASYLLVEKRRMN